MQGLHHCELDFDPQFGVQLNSEKSDTASEISSTTPSTPSRLLADSYNSSSKSKLLSSGEHFMKINVGDLNHSVPIRIMLRIA